MERQHFIKSCVPQVFGKGGNCCDTGMHTWLVWLSGLSAGLRMHGPPVQFPVRAHTWIVGQVPCRGLRRGTTL